MSPALLFGEHTRWQKHFQRNLESMLHAAISRQMEHAFDLLEAETRSVWTQLQESMRANLTQGAQERLTADAPDFAGQRLRLAERIETATVEVLTGEGAEQSLRAAISRVGRAVRTPCWLAMVLALAAGVLTWRGLIPLWAGGMGLAAAVVVVIAGIMAANARRRAVLTVYRTQSRVMQDKLGETVATLIRQAVEAFYARAELVFEPLEAFCHAQEIAHQPILARVDAMATAFQKLAARL